MAINKEIIESINQDPDLFDYTDVMAELTQAREELARTQAECTKLLLEKNELETRLGLAGALAQVRAFHDKFGVQVLDKPAIPDDVRKRLRCSLIAEEFEEFREAWDADNLVEIADSLADMIYVILGTALSYGIPLDVVFEEVQRTNMAKERGGTRGDGKILKPQGWQPPDIAAILEKAGH